MKRLLLICIVLVAIGGSAGVLASVTDGIRLTTQSLLFGSPAGAEAQTGYFWEDAIWAAIGLALGVAQLYLAIWAFRHRNPEAA